jgi:hypothetical protein
MTTRAFPKACAHGELRELFDDVFFVSGGVRMNAMLSFSRNMTVLRHGESLTLINTMRLDDAGLEALDALGKVEHVVRLAGFHGMDDPFYKDRYGATVWAVEGQIYAAGFDAPKDEPKTYFEADRHLNADSELPVSGATLFQFASASTAEGMLLLDRDGGILISGDCMQNWHKTDRYFSFLAKPMMKLMGFIKPHNIGPGWLKGAKPEVEEVRTILDLEFEHVLPAHGTEVIGNAHELFRPAIERL